jgi:D-alanyl-D-alanine carboxypeptidase
MAEAVSGRSYENLLKASCSTAFISTAPACPPALPSPRHSCMDTSSCRPIRQETWVRRSGPRGLGVGRDRVPPNDLTASSAPTRASFSPDPRTAAALVDGSSEPAGPGRNEAGLAIFRHHKVQVCSATPVTSSATPAGRRDAGRPPLTDILHHHTRSGLIKPEILAKLRSIQENACALCCADGRHSISTRDV